MTTKTLNDYYQSDADAGVPGWKYPTTAALLVYWSNPTLYAQWCYLKWLSRAASVLYLDMEDLQ